MTKPQVQQRRMKTPKIWKILPIYNNKPASNLHISIKDMKLSKIKMKNKPKRVTCQPATVATSSKSNNWTNSWPPKVSKATTIILQMSILWRTSRKKKNVMTRKKKLKN